MRSRRVLFFPWGAGGGAAYTGHCIVLADQFKKLGFEVAFSSGGISDLIERCGYPVLPQDLPPFSLPENVPAYLPFANLERVYSVAARFYRPSKLEKQYAEDSRIIEEWKPDLVVVDMVITAALAARARSIPVLSIAEADFLSRAKNSWMPWFEGDPSQLLPYPNCLGVFNDLCTQIDLPTVEHLPDFLWGDVTVVPSIAELDPVDRLEGARGRVVYAGPLYWNPPWVEASLTMPPKQDASMRNLYVTLGSGGMGHVEDIQKILRACGKSKGKFQWNGFASLGLKGPSGSKHAVELPDNIQSGGFTGLKMPLEWADLVITHGGSATVLATLLHGKPMVVFPFMSECEMNGRQYVENTGCGVVARKSEFNSEQGRLEFKGRHQKPTDPDSLSIESIISTLEEVAGDSRFRDNAEILSKKLKKTASEFYVSELVELIF